MEEEPALARNRTHIGKLMKKKSFLTSIVALAASLAIEAAASVPEELAKGLETTPNSVVERARDSIQSDPFVLEHTASENLRFAAHSSHSSHASHASHSSHSSHYSGTGTGGSGTYNGGSATGTGITGSNGTGTSTPKPQVTGTWNIAATTELTYKFRKQQKHTLTGGSSIDEFIFGTPTAKSFSMADLPISGAWEQNGRDFTIRFNHDMLETSIESTLKSNLASIYNINDGIIVNLMSSKFSGNINKDGSILRGKQEINFNVVFTRTGMIETITCRSAFTGSMDGSGQSPANSVGNSSFDACIQSTAKTIFQELIPK